MESEHRIILTLYIFLSLITFLNICSLEYFHIGFHNKLSTNDIIKPFNSSSFVIQVEESKNGATSSQQAVSLVSLDEILIRAGVEVTDEIQKQLPPKEDVASMYGSEPVIFGLEQCERFQNTVVQSDAFIGPAGMFNTGTNLLENLLTKNCFLPDRIPKHGKQSIGIRYQVPWGKHSPVSWRYKHSAPSMVELNQTAFLAAVVIKDPYTWMDSMCRHSYEANWKHIKGHCPNLVPISTEEKKIIYNEETFSVNVHYRDTNITHHKSLVDLWNTWYGNWLDAEFPRVVVRFEDLLFHTEYVVGKVCECAGGQIRDKDNFKYSVDSAKTGKAHAGSNGLVKSITKYSNKNKRILSFQSEDLLYAVKTLRSDIMKLFNYVTPTVEVEH